MAAGDLCALSDVTGYLPGYSSITSIDNELSALISSVSTETAERTGREFTAISPAANPRVFDIDEVKMNSRKLAIGDLAGTPTSIVQSRYGQTLQTFTIGTNAVLLPRVRQAWEPYTTIWFPWLCSSPAVLFVEDIITVDATGSAWGFPSVPNDIKQAVAKLVVVRYLTDVAGAGTALADAVTDDINIGGLFRSAEAVIERYQTPWLI